jgi:uncharacterized membrane protein
MLTTLMLGAAFSVDLGRLRTARRDLQADADFLALDAASVLDGQTVDEALPLVVDEANASAERNHYAFEPITADHVELGIWQSNSFTELEGDAIPNAVRITLTDSVDMLFDLSTARRSVTRSAIGVNDFPVCLPFPCTPPNSGSRPASRAELGSVLARLDTYQSPAVDAAFNAAVERQATFMNHLYTAFLGITEGVPLGAGVTGESNPPPVTGPSSGLRLDALSYKGLADAMVSIDEIAEVLAADGRLTAGSVDALIAAEDLSVKDFLDATVFVLAQGTNADIDASSILGDIAAAVDTSLTMDFGRYLQASTGRAGAIETFVNVDDLLLGSLSIINGRNFVDVELPLNVPGSPSTVLARVTIIEPPQWHQGLRYTGDYGPSTAQIRVEVNVPVPSVPLDLGLLNPLLSPVTRPGNIPLVLEVAKAESRYADMACPSTSSTSWTDLHVENGGLEVSFDSNSPGILATAAGLLDSTSLVHGQLGVSLLGLNIDLNSTTAVDHVRTWVGGLPNTGDLGANIALIENYETRRHVPPYQTEWLQYPSSPVATQLLGQTFDSVQLNSAGLTAGVLSWLTQETLNTLGPIADQLDDALADPLLQAMGVTLAGSDARVQQLLCESVFVS